MSRVVWTTLEIEKDLEERTWSTLSEVSVETLRCVVKFCGMQMYAPPKTALKFEFATDAQAIAFRLTHPDHLQDRPAIEGVHWSPIIDVLNRLPQAGGEPMSRVVHFGG